MPQCKSGDLVYAPLRSLLNKRSTFHFGRCWTRGLHSVPVVAGQAPLALSNTGTQHPALIPPCRPMSVSHCVQARPVSQPPSGAFIVNFHAALRAAPPRMKARIAPCLRHSRNPAPKYSDFPLPTAGLRFAPVVAGRVPPARSNRPHTLGLSNVQTQGQVNLPLCLPT